MAKPPVEQQPQETLITSAVRPRKRRASEVTAMSPDVRDDSPTQRNPGAEAAPRVDIAASAASDSEQLGSPNAQTGNGRPVKRPALPTPSSPAMRTPARQRNSAAALGNTPADLAKHPAVPASSPTVQPERAAGPSTWASPTEGMQSPITSRQRPRGLPAAPAPGAKPCGPQHDRKGHVPPPDHHAEARVGALPAPSALPRPRSAPVTRIGSGPTVSEPARHTSAANQRDTASSPSAKTGSPPGDSQPNKPARLAGDADQQTAECADARHLQQSGPDQGGAGPPAECRPASSAPAGPAKASSKSALESLFSPVFTLFGGKAASEIPAGGGGCAAAAAEAADTAASGELAAAAAGDDDVHSDHDTQIRVPSHQTSDEASGASRSDADSEPLDDGALLVADEAMDDIDAAPAEQAAAAHAAAAAAAADEEEYMEFDPYLFIRKLPPLSSVVPSTRRVLLPRQTRACKRKTLVLDLDETLVHSTLDGFELPDFSFPVFFNNKEHTVAVRQRPHLALFLERVAELFEVVVFTASQKVYAEQLLNVLDPERRLIRHRVFRDSCVFVDGNYLKDLSVLGRDLRQTVIIDNSPQAFGFQLSNGIPIESWYDDEADEELLHLLPFLESLVDVDDVRPLVTAEYALHERVAQARDYEDDPVLPPAC